MDAQRKGTTQTLVLFDGQERHLCRSASTSWPKESFDQLARRLQGAAGRGRRGKNDRGLASHLTAWPFLATISVGVDESRWAPQSSKLLRGVEQTSWVGSTPIHSRLIATRACRLCGRLSPCLPCESRFPILR